jgi:hypothetical protein
MHNFDQTLSIRPVQVNDTEELGSLLNEIIRISGTTAITSQ